MTANFGKVVVIRPGALGDVLALMPTIRFLKDILGARPLVLLAPAGRGKFLRRDGWADEAHDWDGGLFAPLFHPGKQAFSDRLKAVSHDARLVVSFAGTGDAKANAEFAVCIGALAPAALFLSSPPIPPDADVSIYSSLFDTVRLFCEKEKLVSPASCEEREACMTARLVVPGTSGGALAKPYFVMHPGSGSRKKNWPVKNFAELAVQLLHLPEDRMPKFTRLVVTSGEADAGLGEDLAAAVPGAALYRDKTLTEIADVLAGAELYVGNDSGISHLAASVCAGDGTRPKVAALFGPTNRRVWSPRDAMIVPAGPDMDEATAEMVLGAIAGMFLR